MSGPHLTVVADAPAAPKPETVAQAVQRLQAQARQMAKDHIDLALLALQHAADLSREIAAGGDAYPDGARQELAQVAREIGRRLETVNTIIGRTA